MRGKLIAIEGLDGAGLTTHASLLRRWLSQRDVSTRVILTKEPTDGPIGAVIRQALRGTTNVPDDAALLALLFAADRLYHWHVRPFFREDGSESGDLGVGVALERGHIVVSDRYLYSSLAFQGAHNLASRVEEGWIREINKFAPPPDLLVFLDVPPDACARRLGVDRATAERFEGNMDATQRVYSMFHRVMSVAERDSIPVARVRGVNNDGSDRPLNEVQADIRDAVTKVILQPLSSNGETQ